MPSWLQHVVLLLLLLLPQPLPMRYALVEVLLRRDPATRVGGGMRLVAAGHNEAKVGGEQLQAALSPHTLGFRLGVGDALELDPALLHHLRRMPAHHRC